MATLKQQIHIVSETEQKNSSSDIHIIILKAEVSFSSASSVRLHESDAQRPSARRIKETTCLL